MLGRERVVEVWGVDEGEEGVNETSKGVGGWHEGEVGL